MANGTDNTSGLEATFQQWTTGLENVGLERDAHLDTLMNMAAGGSTSNQNGNGNVNNGNTQSASLTDFQVAALKYNQSQAKVAVVDETSRSGLKIVKDGAQAINR